MFVEGAPFHRQKYEHTKLLNNKLHSLEKKLRQVKIYVASVKYLSSLLFHESLVSL